MTEHPIDLTTWDRAETFRWFRSYAQPHFAVTCRVDVSHLMTRKAAGLSPYHACLWAVGQGLHSVDDLRTRFRGDTVVRHDSVALSFTVPRAAGGFGYAYQPWQPDLDRFDAQVRQTVAQVRDGQGLKPNSAAGDAVAYLSCLPWLDFTALDHAVPGPDDCIPRVSWGKIVPDGDRHTMAVNIQVHHALTDGAHLGAFYAALQEALNTV